MRKKLSNFERFTMIAGFKISRFFDSIGQAEEHETIILSFAKLVEYDPYSNMNFIPADIEPLEFVRLYESNKKKYKEKNLPYKKTKIQAVLMLDFWSYLTDENYFFDLERYKNITIDEADGNSYSPYLASQSLKVLLRELAYYSKSGETEPVVREKEVSYLYDFYAKAEALAKENIGKETQHILNEDFLKLYSDCMENIRSNV